MDVTISDTTFWKTWNTLLDLESFFGRVDTSKLSSEDAEDIETLREAVGWRLNNLTPTMQNLKENESAQKTSQE